MPLSYSSNIYKKTLRSSYFMRRRRALGRSCEPHVECYKAFNGLPGNAHCESPIPRMRAEDAGVRSGLGAETNEGGDGMSGKKRSGRLGSSFSDHLKSEGSYEEISTVAVKRVLAWQLAMRKAGRTKNEMAKRMHTSRSRCPRARRGAYSKSV